MKRIAIVMALTIFPAFIAYGEFRKWQLDREVDRLCAIDGGIHIYEQVRLPKESFGPDGEVFPQYRHLIPESGELGPDFFSQVDRVELVRGNPELVRSVVHIYRRDDKKLLGEQINYIRGGGDIPGPWSSSTHQCSEIMNASKRLRDVFVKES
ncbi:hypothetical protein [Denitromonas sp.]|uniref:hypothetical protein n=1 Tax=Denitromonas sp. TaxID=2734609 RepID=UPI003A86B1A8